MDFRFMAMDRHADKSARDDRETRSATNFKESQDSRIFDGFCALCSGEQGDKALCLSTQRDTNSRKRRKKTESKTKGGKL